METRSKKLNKKKNLDSFIVVDDDSSDEESSSKRHNLNVKKSSGKKTTSVAKSETMSYLSVLIATPKSKEITPQVKRSREKNQSMSGSGTASPKKRYKTLLDCWSNDKQISGTSKLVDCPACGSTVLAEEINNHLDVECQGGMIMNGEVLPETSQENKALTPCSAKDNLSNIIAQNKSSSCSPKIKSQRKLTNSATKTSSCSQTLISSNKCSKNVPNAIDADDEEEILKHLSNELAKPLISDAECDGKAKENVLEMKSELCEKMGDENMGNEKVNEWDNKNDLDAGSDGELLNCHDMKVDKQDTVFENELIGDDDSIDNADITENQEQQSDPYYLVNFHLVLDSVLSNEEDSSLFDDFDHRIINQFQKFPPTAQKLYIRLFQRKPGWFRCSKLNYPKIAEDLLPVLNTLIHSRFLENEKNLTDVKEALQLLYVGEIRVIAKEFHLPKSAQQKGRSKEWLIDCLIQRVSCQKTLFGNGLDLLLKRAKKVLDHCVRVSSDSKSVFSRLLLLFSMNIIPEDEDNKYKGQSQQLSTLMLVNMGKLEYPEYNIIRQKPIFKDRDHMIKFAEAYQEKHEMSVALEETGDLDAAYSFYPKAAKHFKEVLSTLKKKKMTFSSSLPVHLRCFTPEWVYTRMCYLGVEVLQKKRQYEEAVGQLELLLEQDTYCAECRGLWWERLALNVHQHLRKPVKALQIINQGLEDKHVRFGRRLALVQRARKILSSASIKKKNDEWNICDIDEALLIEPLPAETITINGKRSADLGVFISHMVTKTGQVNEDIKTFLSVEEFALSHYRQQGYDEGIHGETSTFTTLYGLFFWDILFLDWIPDVFRGRFQEAPLDIKYDTFYTSRKEVIDQRLLKIETSTDESLVEVLEKSWLEHEKQICSGVNWECFESVQQAKQLVSCIGGKVLAGIFKHFAQDMRHWHSGMPDLVVWKSSDLQYRIVEVKGPGDRLSTKQQVWLGELASFGATVEVCYVTAVGGKKLVKPQ